ncbi:MAG: hypothetical protein D3917_06820 [Candidatus Electrothrix sp. AX5]|nr:hypothetical protein [Candidatus Electrothrix sp. AX5]
MIFFIIKKEPSGFTKNLMSNEAKQERVVENPSLFCEANKIAFSQDDRWIATAHGECNFFRDRSSCDDIAIRIWNTETGGLVREMYGHTSQITALSWHPNSQTLASGGSFSGPGTMPDNRVLIWEIKPLWDIAGWEDGSLLTLPYAGFLPTDLWGKDKEYIEGGWLSTAFWGKNKESVKIALTRGGCTACSYQKSDLYLISWDPSSWSWNSDGWKWSEVGSFEKPDNPKGKIVDLDELLSDPRSPDGKKELFWLNKGSTMPVYSEESWKEGWEGDGHKKKNEEPNVVRITDYETGKILRLKGHESWVSTAEWSPEGKRVLTSSSDGTVRIWNAENGREMARYELEVDTYARATWSLDGKWILVGYPEVKIWSADVNELLNKAESLIKALDGDEQ